MAHSGKRYPVAFRRDFNLNVMTNNIGLAKGYALKSQIAGGTIGHAMPGKRFLLIAQDEVNYDGIKWESKFQPVGGRSVAILMVLDPDEVNSGIVARGQLIDSARGSVAQFSIGSLHPNDYRSFTYGWDQHYFPQQDLFLPLPESVGSLGAILWPEWNNL